jgi:hypothetical protein
MNGGSFGCRRFCLYRDPGRDPVIGGVMTIIKIYSLPSPEEAWETPASA